jgi:hypothetical protein
MQAKSIKMAAKSSPEIDNFMCPVKSDMETRFG